MKDNSYIDQKEFMSQNRSTLYHFFKDNGFNMKSLKIGKGTYKVFQVPDDWEISYLMINEVRITDFHSVIIFTNELVVRFSLYDDCQINIPYSTIKYIEVKDSMYLGYHGLHMNKDV